MRTASAVPTGWWPRLLLLTCTLLGLAAMHTIGHGAHVGPGHPIGSGVAGTPSGPLHHDEPARAAPSRPGGHGAAAPDRPGGHGAAAAEPAVATRDHAAVLPVTPPDGGTPLWSVCLAVLGALGTAVLLALRRQRGTRPATASGRPVRPSSGSRGPPRRALGLRLATVSVLRR
ncbi:hypothetical protein [Micromonospora sp. CPCC 205556]|uniref:hypothetical protein n=1 Tax=Micromonospora sp. CPCC 205556 TaxID=3122398 RepID=UPI002FEEFE4F